MKAEGETVGQAVAQLMNYDYVDRKTILDDMRKAGKQWEEQASHFDENYPSVAERYEWTFRGFVASTSTTCSTMPARQCGDYGTGRQFSAQRHPVCAAGHDQSADRATHKKTGDGTGRDEQRKCARWLIEKADREMARAVYLIYGQADWDDPAEYDMVFDTSVTTMDQISARS